MKNTKKDAQYSVSAKICLAEALIALMEQTPLDSIKIQVLAKKAGVSRMSYYRYFSNKIEILEFYIEYILDEYLKVTEKTSANEFQTYEHILDSLKYFFQYKGFICCLKKSGFGIMFLDKLNAYVKKQYNLLNSNEYILYYYVGGIFNIYIQWITRNTPESAEEIASIIFQLCKKNPIL